MPFAPPSDLPIVPGYAGGILSEVRARLDGGSLDGLKIGEIPRRGTIGVDDGTPNIVLAVRSGTQTFRQPVLLQWWAEEHSAKGVDYAETERYARRLASAWHGERYDFSRWERPGRRFSPRTAVYRFREAFRFEAVAGDAHWTVAAGPACPLPLAAPADDPPAADRWEEPLAAAEAAADAFHRVAALLPAGTVGGEPLDGPKAAVEAYRAEARRLAVVGRSLDALPDPDGSLAAKADAVHADLAAQRDAAVAAVARLADLHLAVPAVFPDDDTADGAAQLVALSDAIRSLADKAAGRVPPALR